MTAYVPVNTIRLRGNKGHRDERISSGTIKPGHLVKVNSSDLVVVHDGYGQKAERMFALEDSHQGNLATTSYTSGDLIFTYTALPGDIVQARAASGSPALSPGDFVISNGDGTLVKSVVVGDSMLYSNTAASAAVTNTTTETAFDKTYGIPANSLKAGDVVRIRAQGIITGVTGTPTLTVKLYLADGTNTTAIISSAAVTVAANDIFVIDAQVIIRTSTTYVVDGMLGLGTPNEATTVVEKMSPEFLGSTAILTTAINTVSVKATWSAASASNTCRLDVLTVQLERTGSEDLIGVVKLDSGYTVDPTSAESLFPCRVF